mgnify:CR=1 FL=1
MKLLLGKLTEQIKNNVAYLNESGYYCRDTFELVQLNKYPFFNIVPSPTMTIETTSPADMSITDIERIVYTVIIQFAARSIVIGTALIGDDIKKVKGLLDVYEDIMQAIKVDKTISNTVSGLLPGSSINFDVAQDVNDKYYIAVGEITLKFYKDVGTK